VVGVGVSFVPLAADYTRHSRSPREAAAGVLIGYSATQILCYALGLLALLTVARHSGDIFGAFIALPLGSLAFAVLAARELDQSFADVYSTAMSIQNLKPLWDRRLLAVVITALATTGALWLNIADYENFLTLIGSVFVPLSAVLVADYFIVAKGNWDLSQRAGTRWRSLIPWAAGFVVYQLINPGYVTWWVALWKRIDASIGFTPASWMSASILSFVAAGLLALLVSLPDWKHTRHGRLRHRIRLRGGQYRRGEVGCGVPVGCPRGCLAGTAPGAGPGRVRAGRTARPRRTRAGRGAPAVAGRCAQRRASSASQARATRPEDLPHPGQ
jgi:hypothetical protein